MNRIGVSAAQDELPLPRTTGTARQGQTRRMWTFLAALAGGLVALLGSVGTTYYVQRQAIKAERRARATQAADEILAAVTALRELQNEPGATDTRQPSWREKRESLIYRILAQVVLIPIPGFQERVKFAAEAMLYSSDFETFGSFSEVGTRDILCAEIIDCLGAYYQGRPMPPERKATTRVRAVVEQTIDLEDT
jgi:hypothetical protein